jgi:hypothetical protein
MPKPVSMEMDKVFRHCVFLLNAAVLEKELAEASTKTKADTLLNRSNNVDAYEHIVTQMERVYGLRREPRCLKKKKTLVEELSNALSSSGSTKGNPSLFSDS